VTRCCLRASAIVAILSNLTPTAIRADVDIRAALAAAHAPGASVLIARNGIVDEHVEYGLRDIARRIPVDRRTRFEIGSISKQFTAVALLQLVERGNVKLDDPIARYLPATPQDWRTITIRHLLAHTSGLWDWEEDPAFAFDREYSAEEFIEYIAGHPMKAAPGAHFSYTNSGYPLLGMIVRRAANRSFESYVEANILEPAGMRDTSFVSERRATDALGYQWKDGGWTRGVPSRPRILIPNGGVVSTAADMLKWDTAIAGGRLLARASLDTMWAAVHPDDGSTSPYGLGWFVQQWWGHDVRHHIGETAAGFSSVYARFPDDGLVIIVLANVSRVGDIYEAARAVAEDALRR